MQSCGKIHLYAMSHHKGKNLPGVVAYVYNPSYSGVGDQEIKRFARPRLNQ
jgi:hypothetical protein